MQANPCWFLGSGSSSIEQPIKILKVASGAPCPRKFWTLGATSLAKQCHHTFPVFIQKARIANRVYNQQITVVRHHKTETQAGRYTAVIQIHLRGIDPSDDEALLYL